MSTSVLKKFGKYFLLDLIGEGGMAEIFRARIASLDANGRLLVIKRIQAAYSNNPEFLQMFRSEVQVTMRFTHPNIVQLYEAGEEVGMQFIAMEFVDGRNLRQVLSKLHHKQQRMPIPAAAFIVEQTAQGLHYAHTFKDRITGEPLNLVHRDVSPQNLLLSYDGNIKVIDFGIAKATTNGEATRAGVIKGKLSYLSPEQVLGEVLDSRSDIFAMGIVLWELLTGKRLFVAEGENEFQVLKMIESCNTFVKPPSTYNTEISRELDMIVMQALARDPRKRFQTGEEMARALRKVLAHQFSDFGPSDLSQFVKKLFHELIVDDRKQLQMLNSRAEELIALGTQDTQTKTDAAVSAPAKPAGHADHTRVAQNFMGDKFDKSQMKSAERLEINGPKNQLKVPIRGPQATRTGPQVVRPTAHVRQEYDPYPNQAGPVKGLVGLIVAGLALFFAYNQWSSHREVAPAPTVKSLPVSTNNVKFRLRIFPDNGVSKTRATINSQVIDMRTGAIEVPMGESLELVVERPGFETLRKEFTVKDDDLNDNKEMTMQVKLEPMAYGLLSISTQPALAQVSIVNIDQGSTGNRKPAYSLSTPIELEKLPAGHYQITIRNDLLNVQKTIQVEIKEGDRKVISNLPLDSN
ncbi:MAG: serine/threonine protein kinase [Bdellovibrionales bacterium]|nr:serine/threonine protein kinase [Bdellovibrionales bacterium]